MMDIVVNDCRLYLQAESVRGEGRWHYVKCLNHEHHCPTIKGYDGQSAFVGRAARERAEAAATEMAIQAASDA